MKHIIKTLLTLSLFSIHLIASSQGWAEIQKIVASDRDAGDYFGYSVSISGDYAIVGATFEKQDTAGSNWISKAGSAYIFERNTTGTWVQVQKIVASDRGTDDYFGWSVSISGDYVIVGAYGEDEDASGGNTLAAAGSAYIFERNTTGTWIQVQKIVASDRGGVDQFGRSVSISGDDIVVGALGEAHDTSGANYLYSSGSAYIFERNTSGMWIETQKIVASDRGAGDYFGWSVSISGDDIIIGAQHEDNDLSGGGTFSDAGSAYIFERNTSGIWTQIQKIVASDRYSGDIFGYSVSISGDYAIVGAAGEDNDVSGLANLSFAGSAYLFKRDTTGTWNQAQKIVASDRGAGDQFGISVSISGNYFIVGALLEDEDTSGGNTLSTSGSAYLFKRDTTGTWTQAQKIVNSDRAVQDNFGRSVAISGNYFIVGAPLEDEDASGGNTLSLAGSAYIFSDLLCSNTYDTTQVVNCNGYFWPQNGSTYLISGLYQDTILNSAGCDSIISLSLTINQGVSIITQPTNQTVFTGNNAQFQVAASGSSLNYQWQMDAGTGYTNLSNAGQYSGTGTAILNISNTITSNNNTMFRCVLTESSGCMDTTDVSILTVDVNVNTSIRELENSLVRIFPNPSNDFITITLGDYSNGKIILTDIQGKKLLSRSFKTNEITISLKSLSAKGTYFVKVLDAEGYVITIRKLIYQ